MGTSSCGVVIFTVEAVSLATISISTLARAAAASASALAAACASVAAMIAVGWAPRGVRLLLLPSVDATLPIAAGREPREEMEPDMMAPELVMTSLDPQRTAPAADPSIVVVDENRLGDSSIEGTLSREFTGTIFSGRGGVAAIAPMFA